MNNFNDKRIFSLKSKLFFGLIFLLDLKIWLALKLLPNKYLLKLAKYKIKSFPLACKFLDRLAFRNKIRKYLLIKQKNMSKFSSCLSLTMTGKILFDLLDIKNEVHIGMLVFANKKKIPHAWLVDPSDNSEITSRLVKNSIEILELYKF